MLKAGAPVTNSSNAPLKIEWALVHPDMDADEMAALLRSFSTSVSVQNKIISVQARCFVQTDDTGF